MIGIMRSFLTLLLAGWCVCAFSMELTGPKVSGKPNSLKPMEHEEFVQWGKAAAEEDPAVTVYGAYDDNGFYLALDVAQKEPVYAGEGRGLAFFDDGVELRINRGKTAGYIQIHSDAGGMLWVQERYKPVSAGDIVLQARRRDGKGYQLFLALPWNRIAPENNKACRIKVEVLRNRVLRPLKFEKKRFSLIFNPGTAEIPVVPATAAATVERPERVINFGRPGFNSAELLGMLPVVLDSHPELVIVMIGTNEVVWPRKFLTPEETAANIRKICEILKENGCKYILATIPPCIESVVGKREKMSDGVTAKLNDKVRAINAHIKAIAAEHQVPAVDFHALFQGDLTAPGSLIRNIANTKVADGVHPTAEGYRKMAGMVFQEIVKHNLPTGKVACVGDSITYGSAMKGQGSSRGETYPAQLRELLEKSK